MFGKVLNMLLLQNNDRLLQPVKQIWLSEAYLEPSQTSKMKLFVKIING